MKRKTDERTAYTVDQLAKKLNMAKGTIYMSVRRGQLPHFRVGSMIRFSPEHIDAIMAGRGDHEA